MNELHTYTFVFTPTKFAAFSSSPLCYIYGLRLHTVSYTAVCLPHVQLLGDAHEMLQRGPPLLATSQTITSVTTW